VEEANQLAAASEGLSVVYDYSGTYPTNAAEEEFCEGPTFNPESGTPGAPGANPNSAAPFAPAPPATVIAPQGMTLYLPQAQ
jgi:hypothetical protein